MQLFLPHTMKDSNKMFPSLISGGHTVAPQGGAKLGIDPPTITTSGMKLLISKALTRLL